jgi:uncharacterized protein YqjF (DUF2071 family)
MAGGPIGEWLQTPARQAAVERVAAHRPWPVPEAPWWMAQTWDDLLFAHWRVPYEPVRALVPPDLELDRFEGDVWLGITPFCLTRVRVRGTLPVPRLSSFPELNVRTYVTAGGRPGIWFFSLDCASPVAVEVARRLYRLPYHRARMRVERAGGRIRYSSARSERSGGPVVFTADYGPVGEDFTAQPGTLDHFLTERYCLYAADGRRVYRADIHHPPWPLHRAEARIELNTMAPAGVELGGEPLLHFAARQDVLIWAPERI